MGAQRTRGDRSYLRESAAWIEDSAAPLGGQDSQTPWSCRSGLSLHLRAVGAWASVLQPLHVVYRARVPGDRGWSLAGLWTVFGKEAWPCCLVTREVGRCSSGICVRLVYPATTPGPSSLRTSRRPGMPNASFLFLFFLFILSGRGRGQRGVGCLLSGRGRAGWSCQNRASHLCQK